MRYTPVILYCNISWETEANKKLFLQKLFGMKGHVIWCKLLFCESNGGGKISKTNYFLSRTIYNTFFVVRWNLFKRIQTTCHMRSFIVVKCYKLCHKFVNQVSLNHVLTAISLYFEIVWTFCWLYMLIVVRSLQSAYQKVSLSSPLSGQSFKQILYSLLFLDSATLDSLPSTFYQLISFYRRFYQLVLRQTVSLYTASSKL